MTVYMDITCQLLCRLVDSYERELIVESLKRNHGNMSAAARDLDLSPRVIHYKIRKLGITPEWYQDKV